MQSRASTAEILKKVRRIEIKSNRITNHLFSGAYHSHFKGRGMAFSEVRAYAYGDDVRAIDWKVTARLREPFIKVFEEERELTMMIVLDVSGSSAFGWSDGTKREAAAEVAGVLAFSAIKNNDKVGLLLFSDQVELFLPPAKGKSHILRIIRECIEFEPVGKGTDISGALHYLNAVLKRKAIVFALSDFNAVNYERELAITSRRHDFCAIRLYDEYESNPPTLGLLPVRDLETGETHWMDTGARTFKQWQERNQQQLAEHFQGAVRRSGAGSIELSTRDSYIKKLMLYFTKR